MNQQQTQNQYQRVNIRLERVQFPCQELSSRDERTIKILDRGKLGSMIPGLKINDDLIRYFRKQLFLFFKSHRNRIIAIDF